MSPLSAIAIGLTIIAVACLALRFGGRNWMVEKFAPSVAGAAAIPVLLAIVAAVRGAPTFEAHVGGQLSFLYFIAMALVIGAVNVLMEFVARRRRHHA